MTTIKPCSGANAIKVVAFAIKFREEVTEEEVQKALDIHQKNSIFKTFLPRKQLHEAVTVELGLGSMPQSSIKKLGGVTFDKLTENGEQKWALIVKSDSLVCICTEYTRWAEVWKQASDLLSYLLPAVESKKVSEIALEYVDEFTIEGYKDNSWTTELFNSKTKYLSPNVFEQTSLWHSHCGFFNTDHLLTKINVDYVLDEQNDMQPLVRIHTQHRKTDLENACISNEFLSGVVSQSLENQHQINKDILRDLLSQNILQIIKLKE